MSERDLPHNVLAREVGQAANAYLAALMGVADDSNIDELRRQYERADRSQSRYFDKEWQKIVVTTQKELVNPETKV